MSVVRNEGEIEVDLDGAVALVLLCPDASGRIRLTPALLNSLADTVCDLERSAEVALVLLSGKGREFCVGADLDRLRSDSPERVDAYLKHGQEVMAQLAAFPVPVIAAVNGLALGGGLELALACDIRWARSRTVFGLPEGRLGLVPAWGAVAGLASRISQAIAWEMLLGQRVSARRAAELGLVGRVLEGRDFMRSVMEAAAELAAAGRDTLAELKGLWRAPGSEDYSALERRAFLRCVESTRRQQ